ncbi:MAG: hypothetical protein HWE10_08310 [Gammaproteobacteria bacterium]|nr:hypothetical protein [Gammaproteobacteria bacterium]
MSLNISPHIPQVVVNSSIPSTEALQKSNALKEVIPPVIKTEASVPQKSREQDTRSPSENVTYDNIQSKPDDNVIPEDDTQTGDDSSQQEQASSQDNQEDNERESSERSEQQEQAEQAEVRQEAAEQKVIDQLEDRDREVKTHEQAHAAVGGALAGAPSYQYQTGPDGKRYAVGGEVSIDVSVENDPEETIRKMQTVQAAALAPAEPSAQDRKVAAQASRNIAEARAELVAESSALANAEQKSEPVQPQVNLASDDSQDENNGDSQTSQASNTESGLAQTFISPNNTNATAQVVSKKYASSFQTKEIYFNAVA